MKTWLVFLIVGFIALVIVLAVRKQRSQVLSRQFPGPNLRRRTDSPRDDHARSGITDSSFIATGAIVGSDAHHGHSSHHADCAPSHDAGASCGSDGGGGGDGGGSN